MTCPKAQALACLIGHSVGMSEQPAKPTTVKEFEDLYRARFGGGWTDTYFTLAPGDLYVGFHEDGTGFYQHAYDGDDSDFRWRQVGDFLIEVTREGDMAWSRVAYRFFPRSETNVA